MLYTAARVSRNFVLHKSIDLVSLSLSFFFFERRRMHAVSYPRSNLFLLFHLVNSIRDPQTHIFTTVTIPLERLAGQHIFITTSLRAMTQAREHPFPCRRNKFFTRHGAPHRQFTFPFVRRNVDKYNLRTTRVAAEKRRTIRIVRDGERVSLGEFSMR